MFKYCVCGKLLAAKEDIHTEILHDPIGPFHTEIIRLSITLALPGTC